MKRYRTRPSLRWWIKSAMKVESINTPNNYAVNAPKPKKITDVFRVGVVVASIFQKAAGFAIHTDPRVVTRHWGRL